MAIPFLQRWLFTAMFLLSGYLQAQVPAHFILGADELAGIDIYGLTQAASGQYWITTSNGLYSYDGYEFQSYTHPKSRNNSLFQPCLDYADNIYCFNLNGQIFRVKDGTMELYHTIPDSIITPYISFDFLPNGDMLVNSKKIYRVRDGKIHSFFSSSKNELYLGNFERTPDGVLTLPFGQDSIFFFTEKKISRRKLAYPRTKKDTKTSAKQFIDHPKGQFITSYNNELWWVSSQTNQTLKVKCLHSSTNTDFSLFFTEEYLYVTGSKGGIRKVLLSDILAGKPTTSSPIFERHFISQMYVDQPGNILLGTFGDGIIVIPKTGAQNFDLLPDQQISNISSDGTGNLLIGGYNGNLYAYRNEGVQQIYTQGTKFIEMLEYFPEDKILFADKGPIIRLSNPPKVLLYRIPASVKGVVRIAPNRYLLATNSGVNQMRTDKIDPKNVFFPFGSPKRRRTYAIGQHIPDSSYLVSTSPGLLRIEHTGQEQQLDFQGQAIHAQDFEYHAGLTYLGTKKHGLLTWDGQQLRPLLDTSRHLLSNQVDQLEIHDGHLYIASAGGFQIFDFNGLLVKTLSASDGLQSSKIKDFAVDSSYIWLLHQYGLQRLPREQNATATYQSRIREVQLYNNNRLLLNNADQSFSHDQNRIKFKILAPSLERQKDLLYAYRLHGLENDWNERPYAQNEIEYKSLPPGKYRFEVVLKHKGNVEDHYSLDFHIRKAYWQTWWFASAVVLLFLGLSYSFYRWRLHLQQVKSDRINELNASRLTAIQSQMNPHFIFNALNSIQNLVLKGDIDNSYSYITKFANLLRRTLNYSDKDLIEFEQEVKLIELYLTLERLRFQKDLEFEIDTGDIQDILVPPLLIQPFIENALLHGLLHKEGPKRITIQFQLKAYLRCTITDNGVGRERAAEIKARKRIQHESFSQKAIHKRFEILSNHYGGELGFEFVDLKEGGKATGTQVILKIPIQHNF